METRANYRIVRYKPPDGESYYCTQRRFFGVFWRFLHVEQIPRGMDIEGQPVHFSSYEDASAAIKKEAETPKKLQKDYYYVDH